MSKLARSVLNVPIRADNASTIGGYLIALLRTLWTEGEGFSGKRPFGDSGWQTDVYVALGEAGMIDLTLDSMGYVESVDSAEGDRLILAAIQGLHDQP